jgi:hypothetical protein
MYFRTLLAATCMTCTSVVNAAWLDNPLAGAQSAFAWESEGSVAFVVDLGPDDGVSGETGTTHWNFEVTQPSRFGMTLAAYNRPPTEFGLWLDGAPVPWTHFAIVPEQISPFEWLHHSNGALVGTLLTPGLHSVTLVPSHPNTEGSIGYVGFSPLQPVPEPSTALLLVAGLLALVAQGRLRAAIFAVVPPEGSRPVLRH